MPLFKNEIFERSLGIKPAAQLLQKLKPAYWFSTRLHCKFAATVQHGEGSLVTKLLALDECLPGRKFLQIVDNDSEPGLHEVMCDEEWLAITRKFNSVLPLTIRNADFGFVFFKPDILDRRKWVNAISQDSGTRPSKFVRTVPCHNPSQPSLNGSSGCMLIPGAIDHNSEEIPIDDVDESKELAEDVP